MTAHSQRHRGRLFAALGVVYVVWSSSYLITSIGVRSLPPFLFGGVRFMIGGALLILLLRVLGRSFAPTLADFRHALAVGFLGVVVSNGCNAWSLQTVPSNQAALLNVSSALWICLLGAYGPRAHPLTKRVWTGLALGLLGAVLILLPGRGLGHVDPFAEGVILLGCLGWALATIYMRNNATSLDLLGFTGLQMLLGGLMLTGLGLAVGQLEHWHWTPAGMWALTYMVLLNACIAYVAFNWLAQNATPAQAGSYAYVNPAMAAVLGWVVAGERLGLTQIAGTVVILAGVMLASWPRRGIVTGSA